MGVVWPLPSGLASGPLNTLNECSNYSSHTPVIKAWLDGLHLIDVFDVVLVS